MTLCAPLTACELFSKKHAHTQQTFLDASALQENYSIWNKKVSAAKIETTSYGTSEKYALIPTSIHELKKYNPILIKGTVFNLEPMKGCGDEAYTKVSVFVDKVIAGTKNIQHRIITFNLNSGFIDQPKKGDIDYIKKAEVPMPQIGSQIITGLKPRKIDSSVNSETTKFFKQNQLTDNNSFQLTDPIYNFWVKNKTDKKYHLNNPYLNKNTKDDWYSTKLLQLTKTINQMEN